MAASINKIIIAILKPLQYMSINKPYIRIVFIRENCNGKPFLKLSMVKVIFMFSHMTNHTYDLFRFSTLIFYSSEGPICNLG